MAHLHNTSRHTKPSWLTRLGNKVKTVAELAGTAKGIWDVGRGIYSGISTYGPIVAQGLRSIAPTVAAVGAVL